MELFKKDKLYTMGVLKRSASLNDEMPDFMTTPKPITMRGDQLIKRGAKDFYQFLESDDCPYAPSQTVSCYEEYYDTQDEAQKMRFVGKANPLAKADGLSDMAKMTQPFNPIDKASLEMIRQDNENLRQQLIETQRTLEDFRDKMLDIETEYLKKQSALELEKQKLEIENTTLKEVLEKLKGTNAEDEGGGLSDGLAGLATILSAPPVLELVSAGAKLATGFINKKLGLPDSTNPVPQFVPQAIPQAMPQAMTPAQHPYRNDVFVGG